MKLARVERAVWGAVRAESLEGVKLLEVRPLSWASDGTLNGGDETLVAIDKLAAGPGDLVLVAHGSRVRDIGFGPGVAAKDVIVAIVDDTWVASVR